MRALFSAGDESRDGAGLRGQAKYSTRARVTSAVPTRHSRLYPSLPCSHECCPERSE